MPHPKTRLPPRISCAVRASSFFPCGPQRTPAIDAILLEHTVRRDGRALIIEQRLCRRQVSCRPLAFHAHGGDIREYDHEEERREQDGNDSLFPCHNVSSFLNLSQRALLDAFIMPQARPQEKRGNLIRPSEKPMDSSAFPCYNESTMTDLTLKAMAGNHRRIWQWFCFDACQASPPATFPDERGAPAPVSADNQRKGWIP